MRPLFFCLGIKFLPIPNPPDKANYKALTGGKFKKEVNNTLLFSATLENTFSIGPGGRSIYPEISLAVSLRTPNQCSGRHTEL